MITRGWQKVSQRALDPVLSTPLHPFDPRGLPAFMNLPNANHHLTIHTDRSYVRPIADLFRMRQRRARHG